MGQSEVTRVGKRICVELLLRAFCGNSPLLKKTNGLHMTHGCWRVVGGLAGSCVSSRSWIWGILVLCPPQLTSSR